MVIWGLAGLVVGFAAGSFVVLWPWGSGWFEAVGTWFTGLVAVSAGIVALAHYRSDRSAHEEEEEDRRQLEEAEAARQSDLAQQQHRADLVTCDARYSSGEGIGKPGFTRVKQIEVEAINDSGHTVRDVTYLVPQIGDERIKLWDVVHDKDRLRRAIDVPQGFTTREDHRDIRDGAEFRFTLEGVDWKTKYGRPAQRLDLVDLAESN